MLTRHKLSIHEKTWREYTLLTERNQSEKALYCLISIYDILENQKLWRQWKDQWLPEVRESNE